jgi:hypothetical protein
MTRGFVLKEGATGGVFFWLATDYDTAGGCNRQVTEVAWRTEVENKD